MIDIETLASRNDAAVVSIGAVKFSLKEDAVETFECVFSDLDEQLNKGRTKCERTMKWWADLPSEASDPLFHPEKFSHILMPTYEGLEKLNRFIGGRAVWGFGATFDNIIMRDIMSMYGLKPTWHYRDDMCLRTVVRLFPVAPKGQRNTHHNALDDALYQVQYLKQIIKEKKLPILDGIL